MVMLLQDGFYVIIPIHSQWFIFTQNKPDLMLAWRWWGPSVGCSLSPETTPTGRGSGNARSAAAHSGSGSVRSPPPSSFPSAAVARTRLRRRRSSWWSSSAGWPFDPLRLGSPAQQSAAEDGASLRTRKVTGWGRAKFRNWWCWIGKVLLVFLSGNYRKSIICQ